MLATLLLLAQLVLPGPPSGPIQPPGMICLGECAGPVVWGPAERGRLVVACDMRSDTCSDGRRITTERATPVPCETSPGVWEMVPEDTGCYSVRGLEAWAQTTSYLSYGAELDRSLWTLADGGELQKLPHGYRLTGTNIERSRIIQRIQPDAGTWTLACVEDTGASTGARLRVYQEGAAGGLICNLASVPGFQTHSCTTTITGTPTNVSVHIYPGTGHVDVAGCWLTKTSTPGRACWGGEAPVTCAADQHTISTEGWPTESGEVCVTVTLGEDAPSPAVILDGRASSGDVGTVLYHHANSLRWKTGSTELVAPALQRGQPSRVCAGRSGGRLYVRVNGAHHEGPEAPALSWEPTAYLGHGRVTFQMINGSISSLRVRSFE